MGRNTDTRLADNSGETNGSTDAGRNGEVRRLTPEETFRALLTKAPWEPLEPLVTDPNQKSLWLPKWFDADLFHKAQVYFQANVFSMVGGKLAGLVALLRIETISDVLHETERSETSRKALKRYADTVKHMVTWYDEDPASEGSWAESLLEVRRRHARVALTMKLVNDRGSKRSKPALSQYDLAMTQFAFCGAVLLRPKDIGIEPTPTQVRAFLHFWRVIGFLIGINDRYNLCHEDSDTAYCLRLQDLVRSKVFVPLLKEPHSETSERLTKALIEGMWCIVPLLEPSSFELLTKEIFSDTGDDSLTSTPRQALGPTATFITHFFYWIMWSLQLPVIGNWFRKYHNGTIRFGLYMIQNYPLLAWWKYGLSYRPSTG